VVKINKGADTKKPLPIIDAKGVTVACQIFEVRKDLLKSNRLTATDEKMTKILFILIFYSTIKLP
tara:strand:+ start:637 stop:831 length:195 start_codon:yes stop_codon:yes gene_type:complete